MDFVHQMHDMLYLTAILFKRYYGDRDPHRTQMVNKVQKATNLIKYLFVHDFDFYKTAVQIIFAFNTLSFLQPISAFIILFTPGVVESCSGLYAAF